MSRTRDDTFQGIGVSPGISIGRALVLESPNTSIFRVSIPPEKVRRETIRLRRALARSKRQILDARERALRDAGEGYARVFDAQVLILEDPSLIRETIEIIGEERVNAEWALQEVVARYVKVISNLGDPYLRERGSDLEDVHARIQQAFLGSKQNDLSELREDVIVISRLLSPSNLVLLNREHLIGLAIEEGGQTSHTAIIANALRVPAIVGLKGLVSAVRTGDQILLDGRNGRMWIQPTSQLLEEYDRVDREAKQVEENLLLERELPTVTTDGVGIRLMANLELAEETSMALQSGAQGVGLYRSEFLYLQRAPDFPSEEDHRMAYRTLADRMSPFEVVVRTLDLGGEKYFHRVLERDAGNSVMGLRAIRFCLHRKDIFRAQLRGFLRAAADGGLALMFPMVSDPEEVSQARAMLEEAGRDLRSEGFPIPNRVPVGVMIELPAAAAIADLLAREVDFFSIGTNDLIQYALAIDRGNPSVAYLYRPLHPAILRLIKGVIDAGRTAGIRVSLCGEMAADPLCAALLVGMGLTELSLKPAAIPVIKHLLRSLSAAEMRQIGREALSLSRPRDIEELLRRHLTDRLPLGYACPARTI